MLSDDVNLNLNKDVDGNTFKITDTNAIKFTKDSNTRVAPNQAIGQYQKYEQAVLVIKKIDPITLNLLYTEKLPIPNGKKEYSHQLISSNIVPKFYE